MSQGSLAAHEPRRQPLLLVLGALWLLLAVAILISQLAAPTSIKVEWQTETEVNTAGFNIYRRQGEEGQFVRLNDALLPSEGSAVSGATYTFIDEDVVAGQTYYYQLEDVEFDSSQEQHPPIRYEAPVVAWWVLLTAAASLVLGLALLIKGLR